MQGGFWLVGLHIRFSHPVNCFRQHSVFRSRCFIFGQDSRGDLLAILLRFTAPPASQRFAMNVG
jgi:hypothetical protein